MTDDVHTCLECGSTKRVQAGNSCAEDTPNGRARISDDFPDEVRERAIEAAKGAYDNRFGSYPWGPIVDAVHHVLAEGTRYRVHELERELDAAGETIRELQQARDLATEEANLNEALRDELDRMRDEQNELRRQRNDYLERWETLLVEYRRIRGQLRATRQNRDDACERVEKLKAENERLKMQIPHDQDTSELQAERDELRAQLSRVREALGRDDGA